MQGGNAIGVVDEGAPGLAAGAGKWRDLSRRGNEVAIHIRHGAFLQTFI
jgi:hypothetical protein